MPHGTSPAAVDPEEVDVTAIFSQDKVNPASYFRRELDYLFSKGFRLSQDGKRVIR